MSEKYYTNERNVQIVISLLKQHGIHRIIASPGTTNMTLVGSLQNDPWFQIWSSVDERSAAYLACGMAEETGEPVVLSCTGATASRNYMPGLTEAYYRKLPVLAITSHRGVASIGHLLDQQIDRRIIPNDIANESVTIPLVHTSEDEKYCTIEANKAILALTHRGGGPAHINLITGYSKDFSVKEIPFVRSIKRHSSFEKLPELKVDGHIAIFIGAHRKFTQVELDKIDRFCERYNVIIIYDRTSGYSGKYGVNFALIGSQKFMQNKSGIFDLVIHIGEVTGNAFGKSISINRVWRVSEDGQLRDSWGKLTDVFEMPEDMFFDYYSSLSSKKDTSFFEECQNEYNYIYSHIQDIPFSNVWIALNLYDKLPKGSEIHLGIFNSLRSWDFINLDKSIKSNCNVGGFGIDGGLSSLVGASLSDPDKIYFGVFGDLAFFYDMNVLGNRHIGNNIRILLINNGKGNEFRLSMHPCNIFGDDADTYMAAAGHYGNQSPQLVKHYAEDLGYKYIHAINKEEFLSSIYNFVDPEIKQSIVFEVFTDTEDERDGLDFIMNTVVDKRKEISNSIKNKVKSSGLIKIVDAVRNIKK